MSDTATKYHFIGIGGIGMSGLARMLLAQGQKVSGSDQSPSYVTQALQACGAHVQYGHSEDHVPQGATVIYSSAIRQDNPEYKTAKTQHLTLMHRSDLLAKMSDSYERLSVSGTHGKTSTSALLAWTLHESGYASSFCVGGIALNFGVNAQLGLGKYFVVEADESDGSFLKTPSKGAIVTNLAYDHLDYYGDEATQTAAFAKFFSQVEGKEHLLWCGDDKALCQLKPQGISYGYLPHCDAKVTFLRQEGWQVWFEIEWRGKKYQNIVLAQVGKHQALNAAAVFVLALTLGVQEEAIRRAFATFQGVKRRAERKGTVQNIEVVDDYAHHANEVQATLAGLRQVAGDRRLVVVFQPHRYSRLKACFSKYLSAFDKADHVIITDVYAAGEAPLEGFSGQNLAHALVQQGRRASYAPWDTLVERVEKEVLPHDLVVTMGAGSITGVGDALLSKLAQGDKKRWTIGVIGGGASGEHHVSLESASSVAAALDRSCYDVQEFVILRDGRWVTGNGVLQRFASGNACDGQEAQEKAFLSPKVLQAMQACDLFFPVLHGPYGEDGTIQGLFEILGRPYLGPNYRSCAVFMDKAMTKKLAMHHGIKTAPFVEIKRSAWQQDEEGWCKKAIASLGLPSIVKPVHTGSSLGVACAEDPESLRQAICQAFLHDDRILVEKKMVGREIEFAVVGLHELHVASPGEILTQGKIYDFAGKCGPTPMPTDTKAKLPCEKIEEGKALAKAVFESADGTGFARIDFFLDADGQYWLNEVNPIPGFTKISLFAKMWEQEGVSFAKLLDRLVILALARHREQQSTPVEATP